MPARPLRPAPEWDDRFTRMVVVSAVAHAALIAVALWVLVGRADQRPLPLVAYTVEVTDPSALGGRLPPGVPGKPLTGGPTAPPAPQAREEPAPAPAAAESKPAPKVPEPPPAEAKPPEAKVETKPPEPPPEPAKPPEPKPEEPTVSLERKPEPPAPKPEPKKVEPPKPDPPKPQAAKPEPPKPAVPEPKKPEPAKPEVAKAEPAKPAAAKPEPAKPEARPATGSAPAGKEEAGRRDDYTAAAERWRSRSGQQGGGLGGADGGSGPIGAGGEGPGGGGQLVGIEFLAYRQQVINTVKAQWTNVIARPGLVAVVRFEIAPDGEVGTIKIERSSGNPAYDASAIRAVQRANPLPAPPARYAREFGEFLIEFHSEEQGGQGAG